MHKTHTNTLLSHCATAGRGKTRQRRGNEAVPHLYPLDGGFYPELLHGPAGLGDVVGGGGCFARHFSVEKKFFREVLLGKDRGLLFHKAAQHPGKWF